MYTLYSKYENHVYGFITYLPSRQNHIEATDCVCDVGNIVGEPLYEPLNFPKTVFLDGNKDISFCKGTLVRNDPYVFLTVANLFMGWKFIFLAVHHSHIEEMDGSPHNIIIRIKMHLINVPNNVLFLDVL